MRLNEYASIKRCAQRHFGPNCAVRLFGSRADDARCGGDIDLHVQVDDDAVSTMACRICPYSRALAYGRRGSCSSVKEARNIAMALVSGQLSGHCGIRVRPGDERPVANDLTRTF
jgi:hypothetical protein